MVGRSREEIQEAEVGRDGRQKKGRDTGGRSREGIQEAEVGQRW